MVFNKEIKEEMSDSNLDNRAYETGERHNIKMARVV